MDAEHFSLVLLANAAQDPPWAIRIAVGAIGLLVLLWGARIYKPALWLSSFGVGAVAAVAALRVAAAYVPEAGSATALVVGALAGGAAVAGLAAVAHRIALVGIGAITGVAAAGALAAVLPEGLLPWWVVAIGAIVGAIALPLSFEPLLAVFTPLVGAVLLAWAAGHPVNPWLIGGAWLFGALFQFGLWRGRGGEDAERGDEEDER